MFNRFWFCLCLWQLVGVFAGSDAVQSVSVMEGDSATLQIHVTEMQTDDEIRWRFGTNRNLIAKMNGVTNTILDGPDGRFRDRLKLNQTGSLTITNTTTTDSGLYEVEISSSSSEDKYRFHVTIFDPQTPSHPPLGFTSHPPVLPLIIVLISAAAAGSLVIVAVIVKFCICRKHRDAVHEDETQAAAKLYKHTELMTESDVTEVIYT
ncbi:uncharacterized protein LOC131530890 isoform X2 [Onychostoma macrolepis]|uniref:uncharacterized protein LOC131530890 isoform X2 n=1 Tax=Onychostoma macrolepis TaxID=369639 RepID=UPI00272BECEE|nr:uncharacterized protein LOC131530890 isoform X2 [Onychostoma macrolepis]